MKRDDVAKLCAKLNKKVNHERYQLESRNGYLAVDLYSADGKCLRYIAQGKPIDCAVGMLLDFVDMN